MLAKAPQEPQETELKFFLGAGALEALAEHPVTATPAQHSRLRSIYYDTPEHDLRNRGLSLRVRECDARFIQTLKSRSEGSMLVRGEWESEVSGCTPELAALESSPMGSEIMSLGDRLTPVFITVLDRAVHRWSDGVSSVEISVDTGEVVAPDGSHPIQELELELCSGDPAAVFELARSLSASVAMTPSFRSKAERGYRLAGHEGAAAIRAEDAAISRRTPAAEAFRRIVRTSLRQIAGNAELFTAARSPRSLHQARVGLRRLRAALTAFKPVIDPGRAAGVRLDVAWLARELELARDVDVFAGRLFPTDDDGPPGDPELSALHAQMLVAQAQADERAGVALRSERYSKFLLDVAAWVELPPPADMDPARVALGAMPVATYARGRLDRLGRRAHKLAARYADLDAETRHGLRLRIKTLRYAAEFFASAFKSATAKGRNYLEATKALQDRLGELNDLAAARRTALKIVGPRASALAFTAGKLVATDAAREPVLAHNAEKAVRRYLRARPYWRGKAG